MRIAEQAELTFPRSLLRVNFRLLGAGMTTGRGLGSLP